jgi:DNA-binding response OmpR family regulator
MPAASLEGLNILVLEDDFYIADDTRETLEAAGATVLGPCRDAVSGFRVLEGQHAHCAVVDINLGQGPSFEPARELLARGIPVVLVTGYDQGVIPAELADVRCLQKPTDARKLVTAVRDVCNSGRPTS